MRANKMRCTKLLVFCLFVFFSLSSMGQTTEWPLKLSANKHYLVDQNNKPFYILADTPWRLLQVLNVEDQEFFLDDLVEKGFNTIVINLNRKQTYGHLDIWPFRENWKEALNDEFRVQIIYLRNFFNSLEWWKLIPDVDDDLIIVGNKGSKGNRITASLAEDKSFAVIYTPEGLSPEVDMSKFTKPMKAKWYNPATGKYNEEVTEVENKGSKKYKVPNKSQDWVLLIVEK